MTIIYGVLMGVIGLIIGYRKAEKHHEYDYDQGYNDALEEIVENEGYEKPKAQKFIEAFEDFLNEC